MAELFDDISRIIGSQMPRRNALRLISSVFVGAALGATAKGRSYSPTTPSRITVCCIGEGGVCYQTGPPYVVCPTSPPFTQAQCNDLGPGHTWIANGTRCNQRLCCNVGETCCSTKCCSAQKPHCNNGVCCDDNHSCYNNTQCCNDYQQCINDQCVSNPSPTR